MIELGFPSPDTEILTLRAILAGKQAINLVEHNESGHWYFFDDRSVFPLRELAIAPLSQVLERDPTVRAVADLPRGWRASRFNPHETWTREFKAPGFPSSTELIREGRGG